MKTYETILPDLNGGLNVRDPQYSIKDNQSPDCLNVWWKNQTLAKRPGLTSVTTLANVYRISDTYNSYQAVHAGTNLYKWDGSTATAISTGALEDAVANTAGAFLQFDGGLYYIDGTSLWSISSTWVLTKIGTGLGTEPYIPTVEINCTPTRTSTTDNEDYNLIGSGFKVTYNGDGTATYNAPLTSLDATEIVVVVGGVTKTLTTHYTWVAATGVVTFTGGNEPAAGTNNVEITFYKTVSGAYAKIAGCDIAIAYGGEQAGVYGGTRAFVMGNSSYPTTYWRCDLTTGYGFLYFPDTSYEYLDTNNQAITAAAKMGANLVIFKESSIFALGYEFDDETVWYPRREVHSSIGCDIPQSIQLIDNRLVFAHTQFGINILVNTDTRYENNVKPISGNIQSLLDKESSMTSACSADWDRYYFFCVNGHMYLWDYDTTPYRNYSDYDEAQRRLAWYKWDSTTATTMYSGTYLYLANTVGIYRTQDAKSDDGDAINAYYFTKSYDMGDSALEKTFLSVYPSFSTDQTVKAKVTAYSNVTDDYVESPDFEINSFGWNHFSWDTFTWSVIRFSKPYEIRAKLKKGTHIQIKVESTEANKGLGLAKLKILWFPVRNTKDRS